MADFAQLVEGVYTITNRRDLVAETQMAVKSATLQLHGQDFFYKDLREVALVFDAPNYLQAIDYRTVFPRYRALKYLRKYSPNGSYSGYYPAYGANGVGPFFELLDPTDILDSYSVQSADVAYVAGDLIQIRSSNSITHCLIGVYQYPDISSPQNFDSWIARECEFAIIYAAAASVFGTVLGNKAKQDANTLLAQSHFMTVRNSNILATGD